MVVGETGAEDGEGLRLEVVVGDAQRPAPQQDRTMHHVVSASWAVRIRAGMSGSQRRKRVCA